MSFIQLIDCRTGRAGEMDRLMDDWVRATGGRRTATHSVVGRDRDDSHHVVEIVEFPSYQKAMKNSELPETGRIHDAMLEICEEPPRFTNLDVIREDRL